MHHGQRDPGSRPTIEWNTCDLPTVPDLRYTSYVLRIGFALSILAAAAIVIAADKKPSDLTLHDLSGSKVSFETIAAR